MHSGTEFDNTNAYPANIRRLDKVATDAANDAVLSTSSKAKVQRFVRKFLSANAGFGLHQADNNN